MIIGTAGHVDHGKTALVHALTGVDTDRLKEEKARGISIDLGFAYLPGPDGRILGFVDVPGHEKFVRNMLAGATGIDFVLLVVAADDGPKPQTLEHLAIIDLLGVKAGLIAITKVDLVSNEQRARACAAITDAVKDTCLEYAVICPVSVVTGEGIEGLRNCLFAVAQDMPKRADNARFRLAVDRSFTLAGTGTVVTGTVLSGTVSAGAKVVVSPSGLMARVRSIHAQNRSADSGAAGERCALNLTGDGISKASVTRGDVVVDPALHAPTDRIDAWFRLLSSEAKVLGQWTPVRLHHAAAEVGAHVVLLGESPVAPGQEAFVQLVLDRPIAAAAGDRFIVRDTSAQRTIGGGRFLDLRAPQRKRRTEVRLAQLAALNRDPPLEALRALLGLPPHFVDLEIFLRDRALPEQLLDAIFQEGDITRISATGRVYGMATSGALRLRRDIVSALKDFHAVNPDLPGMSVERLRLQLAAAVPKPAFIAFLQPLLHAKEVAIDGAWLRLAVHEVRLTPDEERVWRRVAPLIDGERRFRPPRVRDLSKELELAEAEVRHLLKLLGQMGKVDEIAHDHFFLRGAVAEMVESIIDLAAHAANGEFTAAQFRDRVDNGRKVAIQSLEFFDRHGVTLRRGDLRRINPHRLDLFRERLGSTGRAA